ncbi:MAG: SAM-dependent DNA methyltransferase [Chloroflexi bacterium]|nr:SAM-dependent DNA methyltransferase [Chloroflexota bacterium]
MSAKSKQKREFGDFQTPPELAREVCSLLHMQGLKPASIVEPTCGDGNFLTAALQTFPTITNAVGIDINPHHVKRAQSVVQTVESRCHFDIRHADFFTVDWQRILKSLPEPLLVIGNPPWVTNAELASINSANLPEKSNFQKHRGLDAITGKGNFDISEYMLIKALEWIDGKRATIAMLCKTAVARKALLHAWKNGIRLAQADIYNIDATAHFGAAVDACILVATASLASPTFDCRVHDSPNEPSVNSVFRYSDGSLLADAAAYETWKHLEGRGNYKWRSGIKHDCAKVMELRGFRGRYRNGLGETVSLESDYLYPMLKSSEIANSPQPIPSRLMIVPQTFIGEDTAPIKERAPKTWQYLNSHADYLERRASSIYRKRPSFSVFGVGEYSFAPWKVAVSGFYKSLHFRVICPSLGKPVVLDDTCYFFPCRTEEESMCIAKMLNSDVARQFFSAFVFWDTKRPVTVELLQRLNLLALAKELHMDKQFLEHRKSDTRQIALL